jgi:serine/threonine protein phosphatase PrpC
MKKKYKFQLAAFTDAAGKYDASAPREGNEDNMCVFKNLSGNSIESSENNLIPLDKYGLLLVVADGMGGMNAGEVASQIAIDTVKFFFSSGKITSKIASTNNGRETYLSKVIIAADEQIKQMASQREDRKGMGSTLILLWLYEDNLTVTWIGDSRAYRYNEIVGLQLLSKDHSYVQELVDKGLLTYEQTFDHPQNNVITRSLGDPSKKAQPETRHFKVYDGDVILLCSDGLSGVLRDPEIGNIISSNRDDVIQCQERLWTAARNADWYDNVTTILCKIYGAKECPSDAGQSYFSEVKAFWTQSIHVSRKNFTLLALFIILLFGAILGLFMYSSKTNVIDEPKEIPVETEEKRDILLDSVTNSTHESTIIRELPADKPTAQKVNRISLDTISPKSQVKDSPDSVSRFMELTPLSGSKADQKQKELEVDTLLTIIKKDTLKTNIQ